ncbi:MAG: helix-turn-helix domain-containing protein, partial [Ignavibacteriales bacterium]
MVKCNLSTILGQKRMTRRELIRKSDISYTSLKPFYDDTWKGVKRDTIDALCKALDVGVGDLFEYVE